MFYLDTEVDISILERLDFGFDGVFDDFTLDDIYAYGGDVGFISDSKPGARVDLGLRSGHLVVHRQRAHDRRSALYRG